jgi:uncharacterized membrane protein YoaK (UPF0700 family)
MMFCTDGSMNALSSSVARERRFGAKATTVASGHMARPVDADASATMTGVDSSAAAPRPLAEQAAANLLHPLSLALLALTFSTGTVDAVSYLGLGHVFTANMTGNVVLLGFGIAGAGGLPVVAPIVSMAAFALGSGIGGALARRLADHHPRHVATALVLESALLAAAAILAAVAHPHPTTVAGDATIALMAGAMGIRNATVRRIAVPDLTTTVLTMTLTGLAADSTLAGGSGKGSLRRTSAIVAMLAGAVAGALMLRTGLTLPLAFGAALALATALVYLSASRVPAS